ncbi:MAG: hypothetical protein ACTSVU_04620 [Promethearchaeota archaeon]
MRLYNPPSALLPHGDKYKVELAGAKCFLAIDDEKEFINIGNVFQEISMGEFWKGKDNKKIADQIEKINILKEDAEALYNPDTLAKRVILALENVQKKGLIFFGVASFEGNAFETSVFNEMDFELQDQDILSNLYKKSRQTGYPDLKEESEEKNPFVEINFFGDASTFFIIPNKKILSEIAAIVYPYQGNVSGIVAVAQGAANFIILTDNIFKFKKTHEIHVDYQNFDQMVRLIEKGVLAAPISWFKMDLGIKGLETLDGWDDIKDRADIQNSLNNYKEYLKKLITHREKSSVEKMLEEDLGTPIRKIELMSDDDIENDLDNCMQCLNRLNEMDEQDKAISFFYDPPKILFATGNTHKTAIGGAITLISIDVGANICGIADLREDVSWGEYFLDSESKELDEGTIYNIEEDQKFFELTNPVQLRDLYIQTFQKIMHGSEAFLGVLDLESNGFDFSLFRELELDEQDLKRLQEYYHAKTKTGKFPKLQDRSIKVKWYGKEKENFTFEDEFPSILDIAERLDKDPIYSGTYITGVVATTQKSTNFFILSGSRSRNDSSLDLDTFRLLFDKLEHTTMAPLCWFKIDLGINALKKHPYWEGAKHYDSLQLILEKYQNYLKELIRIKEKEDQYRIY